MQLESPAAWLLLCVTLAVIALVATVYCFSRRRNFEGGPRKGEAANPRKVRQQHSLDDQRVDQRRVN